MKIESNFKNLIYGVVGIIVGALVILTLIGIIELKDILRFLIPMFIMVIGVYLVSKPKLLPAGIISLIVGILGLVWAFGVNIILVVIMGIVLIGGYIFLLKSMMQKKKK